MSGEVKKSIYGKEKLNEMVQVFIRQLEEGVPCWVKPFGGNGQRSIPRNYMTHRQYRGQNVLWLWSIMEKYGYELPEFISYKQADLLGGHVRKGEKGHQVIFWEMREVENANPNETTGEIAHYWFTRVYTIFHISQVEGLSLPEKIVELPPESRYRRAEGFIRRTEIRCLTRAGAIPSYSAGKDVIIMPTMSEFSSDEEFVSCNFHELGHASGAKHRLNRLANCKFGDKTYAFEELTAELCSAFLGAHFGISICKVQHAEYLNHWVSALREKPQILWSASTKAQEAYDYLLRLAGENVPFEQLAFGREEGAA